MMIELSPEKLETCKRNLLFGETHIQFLRNYDTSAARHQMVVYYNSWNSFQKFSYHFEVQPQYQQLQPSFLESSKLVKVSFNAKYASFSKPPEKPAAEIEYIKNDHIFQRAGGAPWVSYLLFSHKTFQIEDSPSEKKVAHSSYLMHFEQDMKITLDSAMRRKTDFRLVLPEELPKVPELTLALPFPGYLVPGIITAPAFSAAVSLLIEKPDLLSPFIKLQKYKDGTSTGYLVPICVQGFWTRIPTDMKLAMYSHNQKLDSAICTTLSGELWPHYLEKTYIKSKRGNTCSEKRLRSPLYVLHDLTGIPYQEFSLRKCGMNEKILTLILFYCLENNFPIMLASDQPFSQNHTTGLYSGAVYNLTSRISNAIDEDRKVLYSLRLPFEPQHDPVMFRLNKQEVQNQSLLNIADIKKLGSIFMTADEILSSFDFLSILHYQPDNIQYCMKLEMLPEPFSYFELDVRQNSTMTIQLCQEEPAEGDEKKNLQGLNFLGMALIKRTKEDGETNFRLVEQFGNKARDIWMNVSLEAGNYFLLVRDLHSGVLQQPRILCRFERDELKHLLAELSEDIRGERSLLQKKAR